MEALRQPPQPFVTCCLGNLWFLTKIGTTLPGSREHIWRMSSNRPKSQQLLQKTGGFGGQPLRPSAHLVMGHVSIGDVVVVMRCCKNSVSPGGQKPENKVRRSELGPPPRLAYVHHAQNSIVPHASLNHPRASLPNILTFPTKHDPNRIIILEDTRNNGIRGCGCCALSAA